MRQKIEGLLKVTGLTFHAVILKPVLFPGSTAGYKAHVVERWIHEVPSIRKVVVYDDTLKNHDAIRAVVAARGRAYVFANSSRVKE